jgi:hypothetical protein
LVGRPDKHVIGRAILLGLINDAVIALQLSACCACRSACRTPGRNEPPAEGLRCLRFVLLLLRHLRAACFLRRSESVIHLSRQKVEPNTPSDHP